MFHSNNINLEFLGNARKGTCPSLLGYVPDISDPNAIVALYGEMHVSRLMTKCLVGIPYDMPYSSQPLLTATQSSPETM